MKSLVPVIYILSAVDLPRDICIHLCEVGVLGFLPIHWHWLFCASWCREIVSDRSPCTLLWGMLVL